MTTYYARKDYIYSTGDRLFTIPFSYIDKTYINVYINDTKTTNFVFNTSSQILVQDELETGDVVSIRRETPLTSRLVNFTDTSILNAENQNLAVEQTFDVVQEVYDTQTAYKIEVNSNFEEFKDEVETEIAENKAEIESEFNDYKTEVNGEIAALDVRVTASNTKAENAVNTANNAVNTANSASTKADNAISTANSASATASQANTKADNAVSTANSANTKSDNANTKSDSAISTANNALTTANSANGKSDTAISTANSAEDISYDARGKANIAMQNSSLAVNYADNAVNTANSAETKADNAVSTANSAETKADNAVDTAMAADTKVDAFGEDIEIVIEAAGKIAQLEEAVEEAKEAAQSANTSANTATTKATEATTAATEATTAANEALDAAEELSGSVQQIAINTTKIETKQNKLIAGDNITIEPILHTNLEVVSSNPDLVIQNDYTGTKSEVGVEIEELLCTEVNNVQMYSSHEWETICYGNDKFVSLASDYSKVAYSEDGINWLENDLPNNFTYDSVYYGNGNFVAVRSHSNIAGYSEDGINWTQTTLPSSSNWQSVTYGNGKFVTIAANGSDVNKGAYSTDGINWLESTLPSAGVWTSICYGNNKFLAVEYGSNRVMYSIDGINWAISEVLPSSSYWTSVCYDNGKFIAVASSSNIVAYSEDGINWQKSYLPSSQLWDSVTYGNGKFVTIAAFSNKVAYSEDGINWLESTLPNDISYRYVGYGDNKFVAIGRSNKFSYSINGIYWTDKIGTWENSQSETKKLSEYQLNIVSGTPVTNDTLTLTYTTTSEQDKISANNTQTSAEWGNIEGTLSNQTDLQNALNDKYDTSNPDGYITGINSSDVTAALGYTPYDSSNPSDYQTSTQVNTAITSYHDSTKQDNLVSGTNIKTINNNSLLGSGDISTYHPTIFDMKWADHLLNDIQWLRADTFSWQSGSVYVTAYQHLVSDIQGKSLQSETIANITIQYYLADDGHKICPANQESNIINLYAYTGIAWYYILDTTNTRFKLPRTKYGFVGYRDSVEKFVDESLPNIKGTFTSPRFGYDSVITGTGVFTGSQSSGGTGAASNGTGVIINFNASNSSSIYQDNANVQQKSTQMYLYFYVGEYAQTAIEQTAGLNTELFNNKLDIYHSNDTKPYLKTTYVNGTSGYNIWSNGYCEQWGVCRAGFTSNKRAVSLVKRYKDENYVAQISKVMTDYAGTSGLHTAYLYVKSDISFTVFDDNVSDITTRGFDWKTSGYLANGQY